MDISDKILEMRRALNDLKRQKREARRARLQARVDAGLPEEDPEDIKKVAIPVEESQPKDKNVNKKDKETKETKNDKKKDNNNDASADPEKVRKRDRKVTTGGGLDFLDDATLGDLQKITGIGSKEAWRNIFWLTSKPEHDNEDPAMAFATEDKGVNLFQYAEALKYDWKERGVTIGLVGFTTHCDGKPEGDAQALFKKYAELGGEDFSAASKTCAKDKAAAEALCEKIKGIGNDPKWIAAQWQCLFAPGEGYMHQTMKTWQDLGIQQPSALAIATVFDTSLNQGWDGPDGGCVYLKKLGVHGDENATLEKYNAWRRKVAGTNDYNDPPINGQHRADQYEKLRVAGCFALEDCDDHIAEAISWTMK